MYTSLKTAIDPEKESAGSIEYKSKSISRIIIYYDDNTFEEFDSKRSV